jgi:hypothetical protein
MTITNKSGRVFNLDTQVAVLEKRPGKNIDVTISEMGEVSIADNSENKRQLPEKPKLNVVNKNASTDKTGGIDFNPAALNLNVTRTGSGIQVQFDPAEIQRIKTEGVSGFTPVIINITPIKSMLPALGLAPAEPALVASAT